MDHTAKEPDHSAYAGRWVAMIHGRIVGHGGTPKQARQAAKITRHKETPQVMFVPTNDPLLFSKIIVQVRETLPGGEQAYLVGGAVRDAMLSRPIRDYDFLLSGDVFRAARNMANQIGGAYYPLDEERGAARVVYFDEKGERNILDFVALKESDLVADLRDRDFTINAMAVDLYKPQQLLDPLSGAADLWNKTLRVCSPSAFEDDPIRVMRAIRMAAGLGLRIHPDTRALMGEAIPLLVKVSPERLRDELFRILGGPKPHVSIRALDMLGAVPYILPELLELKNVSQSPPHIKNVWEHTLDTLKNLETLLDFLSHQRDQENVSSLITGLCWMQLGKFRQQIGEHLQMEILPDRSLRSLIFLAALYHDIAKPHTGHYDDDGRIRFHKHSELGVEIITRRGIALRLSKKEIDRLRVIVKHHMQPTYFARQEREPNPRAIYRYFRSTGAAGIEICLISLSDLLATYGNTLPQDRWSRQLDTVRTLMDAWWNLPEEQIRPPVLLTGHDLIAEFGVKPGPWIGELLEMVREAQVSREISTKKDALRFVRDLLLAKSE
jgi:putative nucleotidyltransferase with HDIG domain